MCGVLSGCFIDIEQSYFGARCANAFAVADPIVPQLR
jgi:hypothetical protein